MSSSTAAPFSKPVDSGGVAGWLRRNAQLLIGLLISAGSAWVLSQSVDLTKVGDHLSKINWGLLVLCFLSVPVTMVLKCLRWRYLFGDRAAPPMQPMLSSLYIGYLMNTILPARVGEFVRAYLIGRHDGLGTAPALATIVLEKLLDLGTLALLLVGLLRLTSAEWPEWVEPIARASEVAVLAGLLGLAAMLLLRRRVVALVALAERRVPALRRLSPSVLAASFLDGLAGLARPRQLPGVVFFSLAIWACAAGTMWAGIAGAGIAANLPMVLLALVVTNIGMAVPSAPGYVGTFDLQMVKSLEPFGVESSHAAAAAIIMHILVFGNFIIGGLWFLWRGGYSLGGLRDASGH